MPTLKSYFLKDTSLRTEILAGATTFLTMVYIVFVNPKVLHDAGMDQGAVFTATCLITAFACALTGFIANTPIGVAPSVALNIYFSYSVVQGWELTGNTPWPWYSFPACFSCFLPSPN